MESQRIPLVLFTYMSEGKKSIDPNTLFEIQGLNAEGSTPKDLTVRTWSLHPFQSTTHISKPHDNHLPHRAMKMEKKTVAGLSNRWLARAVPQAELRFQ